MLGPGFESRPGHISFIPKPIELNEQGETSNPEDLGRAWFCKKTDDGFTWDHEYFKCTNDGVNCDVDKDIY